MPDPQPSSQDFTSVPHRQPAHDSEIHDSESSWTWLAEIRRPQGRKGEVLATVLTDFPEKFSERRRLWLLSPAATDKAAEKPAPKPASCPAPTPAPAAAPSAAPRPVELTGFWMHKGSVVLHFAGIDSITDAEALRGRIVAIPRAERAALDADAWYIGDLIGCALIDVRADAQHLVGIVEDVDRAAGPVALLVVRPVSEGAARGDDELLIPLAKSYLRRVDLAARRIEMSLPEGLLDLNAPSASRTPADKSAELPLEQASELPSETPAETLAKTPAKTASTAEADHA